MPHLSVHDRAAWSHRSYVEGTVIAVIVAISQKSKLRLQGIRQQPKFSSLRMMGKASNADKLPHSDSKLFSVRKALHLPKDIKLRTALLNPINTHSRFRSQFHQGRKLKQKLMGLEPHCALALHDVACPGYLRNPHPGNSVKSAFQQESES